MKTIILTGLQGTGKSRLARTFKNAKNVQFIEIQEDSDADKEYIEFGKILIVDLDTIEYNKAIDVVANFIDTDIYGRSKNKLNY